MDCQTVQYSWDQTTQIAGCELIDEAARTEIETEVDAVNQMIAASGIDLHCELTICGEVFHLGNL